MAAHLYSQAESEELQVNPNETEKEKPVFKEKEEHGFICGFKYVFLVFNLKFCKRMNLGERYSTSSLANNDLLDYNGT